MIHLPASWERFLSPNLSTCYRCDRPWKSRKFKREKDPRDGRPVSVQQKRDRFYGLVGVEAHTTYYTREPMEGSVGISTESGCFPLCEGCWSKLTPETRLPYYERMVENWINSTANHKDHYREQAPAIYAAVRQGG